MIHLFLSLLTVWPAAGALNPRAMKTAALLHRRLSSLPGPNLITLVAREGGSCRELFDAIGVVATQSRAEVLLVDSLIPGARADFENPADHGPWAQFSGAKNMRYALVGGSNLVESDRLLLRAAELVRSGQERRGWAHTSLADLNLVVITRDLAPAPLNQRVRDLYPIAHRHGRHESCTYHVLTHANLSNMKAPVRTCSGLGAASVSPWSSRR